MAFTGAFNGMTICWTMWGLATIGDFFAVNRVVALLFTVAGATGIGAYIGIKAQSKTLRIGLGVVALFCLLFWIVIPDGWWALPPPKSNEVISR